MKQHPIYNKERNEKADLLRVIAMLFVVVGHCLMYGVPNTSTHGVFQTDSATDMLLFLLLQGTYVLTSTGVNCFVLLSGYFLIQRTDFRSSLLKIWIQTIFYSILLSGIACIAGKQTYAVHTWMAYLSPFPTEEYWFVTPYMALSVAAPFLARFGNSLNQRQYIGFLSVLFLLFFRYPFGNAFTTGMDFGWFVVLFFTGGYIRRFNVPRWIVKYRSYSLAAVSGCSFLFLVIKGLLPICIHGQNTVQMQLISNNSFTFLTSVCMFLCFIHKEKSLGLSSKISQLAPFTLGVYLIHEHSFIRHLLWDKWFASLDGIPVLLSVFLFSMIVFIGCTAIEYGREKIFSRLGISSLIHSLGNHISRKANRWMRQS